MKYFLSQIFLAIFRHVVGRNGKGRLERTSGQTRCFQLSHGTRREPVCRRQLRCSGDPGGRSVRAIGNVQDQYHAGLRTRGRGVAGERDG